MQQPIHIVIPFKHQGAKSRLSTVLSPGERWLLAFAMLKDVLSAVLGFGWTTVLSRPGLDNVEIGMDVEILESELELNDALNSLIEEEVRRGWPSDILIVMADLALLTEKDVVGILNCDGDVVLCPGRGGGTNMILVRSQEFRVCYQGLSFPRHLAFARKAGLKVSVFESFRAGCDIDEPEDLAEVLLHGKGQTRKALESLGFALSENGRACLIRRPGCVL
ncbi:2-phospho-L-lactate guanylyltransferase [uncultured archaeon]|nr:2-phospho-L-lactate guanylyltransferase [uncultured archaeon]